MNHVFMVDYNCCYLLLKENKKSKIYPINIRSNESLLDILVQMRRDPFILQVYYECNSVKLLYDGRKSVSLKIIGKKEALKRELEIEAEASANKATASEIRQQLFVTCRQINTMKRFF